jgi:glycosyltransferase involved in cell wall biosynthesis
MTAQVRIPWLVRAPVRRVRNASAVLRLTARQWRRWRAIALTPPRARAVAVSYGVESMPDHVFGGAVKFRLLDRVFPNAPRDFNVLYLGSSSMPLDAAMLVRLARRRGAAFVWNQNGVAYPGWYGDGWRLVNAPRARLLHAADYVVYQSAFCKLSADRFCGARDDRFEILHNPVDTTAFVPDRVRSGRGLTLVLGGNQYQRYRLECALEAVALLRREREDVRLLITGSLSFGPDAPAQAGDIVRRLGIEDSVEMVGMYTQEDAPAILRRGDILLHPKYNDPCPTIVLEAMACGLPVAYSASGGTPELVGDDAGVGIEAPLDWQSDHPPSGAELASAVATLADDLDDRSAAARERAIRFDARRWIDRHRTIFEELVA